MILSSFFIQFYINIYLIFIVKFEYVSFLSLIYNHTYDGYLIFYNELSAFSDYNRNILEKYIARV